MLPQQRHAQILDRLNQTGGVRVAILARTFGVTEETIRRDLERLDQAGKLRRTHGGAVPIGGPGRDPPFEVRTSAYHHLKVAIAHAAARHVAEGDVLALDASSTVHELARVLPDIPLTVVTNSIPITVTLLERQRIRVVSAGGRVDPPSRSWVGSFAEATLAGVNITRFFMSTNGVDFARGLSEALDDQARIKRMMMDRAASTYLLVDHTKLGKTATVHVANLDEIATIITDDGAAGDHLDCLHTLGIPIEVAAQASAPIEAR